MKQNNNSPRVAQSANQVILAAPMDTQAQAHDGTENNITTGDKVRIQAEAIWECLYSTIGNLSDVENTLQMEAHLDKAGQYVAEPVKDVSWYVRALENPEAANLHDVIKAQCESGRPTEPSTVVVRSFFNGEDIVVLFYPDIHLTFADDKPWLISAAPSPLGGISITPKLEPKQEPSKAQ